MAVKWSHLWSMVEQTTFTSVFLRVCLLSNIIMMMLFTRHQFNELEEAPPVEARSVHTPCPPHQSSKTHAFIPLHHFRKAYPHATDPSDPEPVIRISSWTELQPGIRRWFHEGTEQFKRCPNLHAWMKCSYQLNEDPHNASDVMLFHVRHLTAKRGLPEKRMPHQKWVFYEVEAPTNVWNKADPNAPFWQLFNITATFSRESDIPYRLHEIQCRPKLNYTAPRKNYAKDKTGKVAWFVSHCRTSSRRELYAEELGKHIQVDVFGGCGNETLCEGGHSTKGYDCMHNFVGEKYKFYLSFENALCREYMTEKLHGIIGVNVIPIVMGSVDYANMLPKGTYIDVRDYKSPKQLAAYLHEIDTDDEAYNEVIRRKNAFECSGVERVRFHCKLCEFLHLHRYERQRVLQAQRFWSVLRRCTAPHDYFRGVADDVIPKIEYTRRPELFL